MAVSLSSAEITNPKRDSADRANTNAPLFPYYAGFSSCFASKLLRSISLDPQMIVLDPWNGAGTTTRVASSLLHQTIGCDLNPAMVMIAKADLVSPLEAPAIQALAFDVSHRTAVEPLTLNATDLLRRWISTPAASTIRSIEKNIYTTLINAHQHSRFEDLKDFRNISPVAAVLYLALFRTTRRLLQPFFSSNPTWIKSPESVRNKIRPTVHTIVQNFRAEAAALAIQLSSRKERLINKPYPTQFYCANSTSLPLARSSVDFVLTSPPYCTRIDYAVATAPELAVLDINPDGFDKLRRKLMGTSTVPKKAPKKINANWGGTCEKFLASLMSHTSKASGSYYLKNHIQYFTQLDSSISEISRVMRPGGACVFVVQDSYYKENHNDLPKITTEMAEANGLLIVRQDDFVSSRSMVNLNTRARGYIQRKTTESVISFTKP